MSKETFIKAMGQIDDRLLDRYMEAEDRLTGKKPWVKWIAGAACIGLIALSIALSVSNSPSEPTLPQLAATSATEPEHPEPTPPQMADTSATEPEVSTPTIPTPTQPDPTVPTVPKYEITSFTAIDIAALFSGMYYESAATNAYTKHYVPDAKYLYLSPIPDCEYLPIYEYFDSGRELDEGEFQDFINKSLLKLSAALGLSDLSYEIEREDDESLSADMEAGNRIIRYSQQNYGYYFSLYTYNWEDEDYRITLNGQTIQIDQRQTDEEIIASLSGIRAQLFDIFGVSFPDVLIVRDYNSYSEYGATSISVYYYDASHPLNDYKTSPYSSYIELDFDNYENYDGDIVSETILDDVSIRYRAYHDYSKKYPQIAQAKMLSLSEAEALLYNGYVFGGHTCPLCMAEQTEISFEGYDYVDLEYVFGYDNKTDQPTIGVPFYAFYKKIGTSKNGNMIYAKTYVPAVEVSGLGEYFEMQKNEH